MRGIHDQKIVRTSLPLYLHPKSQTEGEHTHAAVPKAEVGGRQAQDLRVEMHQEGADDHLVLSAHTLP